MAENHEPGKWNAVVCNGFGAVNVLSSINVEELGWDYTEMELDPTGTCGLFDGMLLDWGDVRVGVPGGPRVRHHARWRANIGQHGRQARRSALLLRRRAEARA